MGGRDRVSLRPGAAPGARRSPEAATSAAARGSRCRPAPSSTLRTPTRTWRGAGEGMRRAADRAPGGRPVDGPREDDLSLDAP